jgi:hypothetical protein
MDASSTRYNLHRHFGRTNPIILTWRLQSQHAPAAHRTRYVPNELTHGTWWPMGVRQQLGSRARCRALRCSGQQRPRLLDWCYVKSVRCKRAFFSMAVERLPQLSVGRHQTKMSEITIAQFKDYDVSPDGRKAVLHFIDGDGRPVAIKVETQELEKIAHNLGFVLTKARQISDISKQGVVPFLRPTRVQADLLGQGSVVILSFAMRAGVEMHYGLEPAHANEFARQITEAARRGLKSKPLGQH